MSLTLYYWGIKARSYASLVVAKAGGIDIVAETNFDLATLKNELPFGQVPYLVHGDVKLAQSNAILRYVAKLAGLQGSTDIAFALSEQLIEESNDIFQLLSKANHASDKAAGWESFFTNDGPKHLAYLEKLLPGAYFLSETGPTVAGEYTIAAVLDFLLHLEPSVLDAFPKLKAFAANLHILPAFEAFKDWPHYFSR